MIIAENDLFSALFEGRNPRCIAFVGGGGKTTSMLKVLNELLERGDRVAVTTTTKTMPPPDLSLYADSARRAGEILKRAPYCVAGKISENGYRLSGLPEEERLELLEAADFVLVEADGARGRPIKFTRHFEPVIPGEAEAVVAVVGLDCVGNTLREAVHCYDLASHFLNAEPDELLDAAGAAAIIRESYAKKVALEHPKAEFAVLLNKYDKGSRRREAEALCAALGGLRVVVR